MVCKMQFKWVKLPRNLHIPQKGVLYNWFCLARSAAYSAGEIKYVNHHNPVAAGEWTGGIVGLKSILQSRDKKQALAVLSSLNELDYLSYEKLQNKRKISYRIHNWVSLSCKTEKCQTLNTVGWFACPRNIADKLIAKNYRFEEAEAFIDLWSHTVYKDPNNIISDICPVIQYTKEQPIITLDYLAKRWRWDKSKVSRFISKYKDTYKLIKLPGSCGSLIFNVRYCIDTVQYNVLLHKVSDIYFALIKKEKKIPKTGTDHNYLCELIVKYSRNLQSEVNTSSFEDNHSKTESHLVNRTKSCCNSFIRVYLLRRFQIHYVGIIRIDC